MSLADCEYIDYFMDGDQLVFGPGWHDYPPDGTRRAKVYTQRYLVYRYAAVTSVFPFEVKRAVSKNIRNDVHRDAVVRYARAQTGVYSIVEVTTRVAPLSTGGCIYVGRWDRVLL